MLPKWHAFWGLVFAIIFKLLVPQTNYLFLFLIFFASVFIDFDHYLAASIKNKTWSLKHAIKSNYASRSEAMELRKSKGICRKGDFHIFHTFEFILAVYLFSFLWFPAIYIFIGMVFHSFMDIIYLINKDFLYRREFSLINWILTRK